MTPLHPLTKLSIRRIDIIHLSHRDRLVKLANRTVLFMTTCNSMAKCSYSTEYLIGASRKKNIPTMTRYCHGEDFKPEAPVSRDISRIAPVICYVTGLTELKINNCICRQVLCPNSGHSTCSLLLAHYRGLKTQN